MMLFVFCQTSTESHKSSQAERMVESVSNDGAHPTVGQTSFSHVSAENHLRICVFTHEHPRTRRCSVHPHTLTTTLVHNTTNHLNTVHTPGSVSLLLLSSFVFEWMCSVGSLLVNKRWDSGERCIVGQAGGCHRQGPWVAKHQCSSTCCGPQAKTSSLHASTTP